jgi:hypothetical protein
MTAIVLEGADPIIQWAVAIVAGGGVAATIQSATVATRSLSSTFTFGLGNSAVATGENVASVALTLIAILIPFISAFVVILVVALLVGMKRRREATSQRSDSKDS